MVNNLDSESSDVDCNDENKYEQLLNSRKDRRAVSDDF
jgi:hypothetical protein